MVRNPVEHLVTALRPLLVAEAAAIGPGLGIDPADLEQAVWLRLLERVDRLGPPPDPERWLRASLDAEARRAAGAEARERAYRGEAVAAESRPEHELLLTEHRRLVQDAVRRLPRSCVRLVTAFLSPRDPTYREVARWLGIAQGSVGPERARCLECLRRLLTAEDFAVRRAP
ncbi:sigma-70 family RNA polymerase sigma factor [Streptomyces cavernicola]|uniref:Sigma-70 family RNA polymerase sigma factor n=1 Tax=Streptomyces cavernicola TaxID=3043613 RepID=A0ABT6SGQ2_9ACTN|nr:sigma-70 family RNA polymerase sigma factor [Streptomyces sp. B-S-A6]MDI3407145.1 sigma-70 family RNA polymerase sigma factor [Streptomyces sp. B-S-A6]